MVFRRWRAAPVPASSPLSSERRTEHSVIDTAMDSVTTSSSTASEEEDTASIYQTPPPCVHWGLRKRRLVENELLLASPPPSSIVPILETPNISPVGKEEECTLPRRNLFRRRPRLQRRSSDPCCIPADHPIKLLWDVCTVVLSCIHAYRTHILIANRNYESASFSWMDAWFALDILLNFITEHRLGSRSLRTVSAISARYLTTWFVIDVLSLVPGEWLFVRPVVRRLQARRRWRKWLARTQTVTRVTAKVMPRWNHVRLLSALGRRHVGLGGVARCIKALIYYIPKYILFLRNMKAVVALRILRQYHWMRKVYAHLLVAVIAAPAPQEEEEEEYEIVLDEDDEDDDDMYFYEDDVEEEHDDDGDPY